MVCAYKEGHGDKRNARSVGCGVRGKERGHRWRGLYVRTFVSTDRLLEQSVAISKVSLSASFVTAAIVAIHSPLFRDAKLSC